MSMVTGTVGVSMVPIAWNSNRLAQTPAGSPVTVRRTYLARVLNASERSLAVLVEAVWSATVRQLVASVETSTR